MADNKKPSEDPLVATDEVGGAHVQRVKVQHGADGSATDVSSASPLPVSDAGGALSVDDDGSSLTVDAPLASPVAARLSDGAEAIGTTAKRLHVDDGGSSLSVDDNGGSLTVDSTALGATTDAEAAGDGSIIGILKRLRKLLGEVVVTKISEAVSVKKVEEALPAGTNAIGKLAANSGVDIGDVDVTSIAAGTNTIGNVGLAPRTSGGLSIFRSLDLDESEEQVKGSAGQVYGYYFSNLAASTRYLKFYNATEASVTVGTTTPVMTLPLPKESSGHVPIPQGLAFSTAITVAVTTGLADNNTGAPAENDVVLNLYYA